MNFGFSEDQELLRDTARKFLDSECPTTFVRKMMADETAHSTELWKKIAQLGWLGIIVPVLGVRQHRQVRRGRQWFGCQLRRQRE